MEMQKHGCVKSFFFFPSFKLREALYGLEPSSEGKYSVLTDCVKLFIIFAVMWYSKNNCEEIPGGKNVCSFCMRMLAGLSIQAAGDLGSLLL